MKVGVPKEVKNHEYRVALTPVGVHELVEQSLKARGAESILSQPCLRQIRTRARHAPSFSIGVALVSRVA